VLEIRLALPGESFAVGPLTALLDTGADATVVPLRHIRPLGAELSDRRYLRGLWGNRRAVERYLLDVEVAGLRLPSIEVVADDTDEEIIVGRDVLNRLRITLDGPAGTLEVTG
jgi:predicted aspartyl protease